LVPEDLDQDQEPQVHRNLEEVIVVLILQYLQVLHLQLLQLEVVAEVIKEPLI
tara:strand:+ start:81 stop:239 length:159 start_codon:yes stop_codon:yes gene_type:complete